MATLSVQKATLTGLDPTFVAASVNSQTPCNYGFDHDAVVAVPAGGERVIGPFPKARFNDASDKVLISYSGVTSVTVAVLEVA